MMTTIFLGLVMAVLCIGQTRGQARLLVLMEASQMELQQRLAEGLAKAGDQLSVDMDILKIDHERENDTYSEACDKLSQRAVSAVVDLTWGGWRRMRNTTGMQGLPYVRLDTSRHQFLQAGEDYLTDRGAVDAALVFETELELDESLFWIIGNSYLRVVVVSPDSSNSLEQALTRLAAMRPSPSHFIGHGSSVFLTRLYGLAKEKKLVKRESRWSLVATDWQQTQLTPTGETQVTLLQPSPASCCSLLSLSPSCSCSLTSLAGQTLVRGGELLAKALADLQAEGTTLEVPASCSPPPASPSPLASLLPEQLAKLAGNGLQYRAEQALLTPQLNVEVTSITKEKAVSVGSWSLQQGFSPDPSFSKKPIKRFFRVGTVARTPWTMVAEDGSLSGYCPLMLKEMAKRMDFGYELILPTDNSNDFGKKGSDGQWSGVVGDLVSGEVDMVVAPMTMTSEREEVIDFVAPYFDQSGISIIIRKPVREQSLFKFMQVLKTEVWLAILGALVLTALMLWVLDRFSPYSARNNPDAHPGPCRQFTLKESFWFALTSFTPQGGGEAPKALSARVLVAAYWLFVVLMLATFTANLAAFLTVERMQSTVKDLEELARQSKINYTVLRDSPYMEYFLNMASAEEDLYRVWKDLTLNSSGDQSKYRVWDYPIKEQYTSIYKVIQTSGMVNTSEAGFRRVLDDTNGTFAFVHDASEVRYEFYNNCNFTEVGEPFAEQPYAVAVQQGSHLNEEISKIILELQKDRYFETLYGRFWNSTLRSSCPTLDDSEGITLRSLGGVFIGTLVGLVIAMVALGVEVAYYRKKDSTVGGSSSNVIHVSAKSKY